MASRASIGSHPVHAILVPLPIGLWVFSFICDVVVMCGGAAAWKTTALYAGGVGVVGALLAALFGVIDLSGIREPVRRRLALTHMALAIITTVFFGGIFFARLATPIESPIPVVATLLGLFVMGCAAWLGGELVYAKGVGVEPPGSPLAERDVLTEEHPHIEPDAPPHPAH
jgi:uncharacterized membrane protein